MHYPITTELRVHITDGTQVGSATYVHGAGSLPSDEDMVGILDGVKKSIPEGFRLMNRAESFMFYLRGERGYRGPNLVIPKDRDNEWYDKESDVSFSVLDNSPEFDEYED